MAESHLSADLLARWLDGEVDDLSLLRALLPHAVSLCAECSRAWDQATAGRVPGQGLLAELQHSAQREGASSPEAIEKALTRLRSLKEEVFGKDSGESTEDLLEELLQLPRSERWAAVTSRPERYCRAPLALALLRRSRTVAPRDPEESEHLADLAADVVRHSRRGRRRPEQRRQQAVAADLFALASAMKGNARRLVGEYREAEVLFQEGHALLRQGSGDPLIFADLLGYQGSLYRDLHRLLEAEKVVRRAVRIYRRVGEDHQAGRALVKLATIREEQGRPEAAVRALKAALGLLSFDIEPHLEEVAYGNLALYVAEAGDAARGLKILEENPPRKEAPRRSLLHWEWIEGRILAMLGQHGAAVSAFELVREGFSDLGDAPNAAVSTLELALLYVESGRSREVRDLAAEALPVLLTLDLSDQAVAALILFEQACQTEELSTELLRSLHRTLSDPRIWRRVGRAN